MTESTMLANGSSGAGSDKVKVAIRVRPFNRREAELKTNCVVEVRADQTILHYVQPSTPSTSSGGGGGKSTAPTPNSTSAANTTSTPTGTVVSNTSTYRPPKTFTFDHCFWSFDENDPHYASQEDVFRNLGLSVLDSAFQGYNACIFAYGQTGSGKSYTMMGSPHEKGLIPRLCDSIFERIGEETENDPSSNFKLEVSYMEIYNEKVHDLLDPAGARQSLKVREHNILGPYVDGLSTLAVSSFEEIDSLMAEGNKSRTVASTNMNSESSRSHAVFTLTLTCSVYDSDANVRGERVSKMSLVDLAGSERAIRTGAVGERLKEGSNINKSLTTLGLVISKLADQASGKNKREQFVPYRDSVLTWLLKDNLGGNSKTIMISTISPAADSYEETLSTLRYADRAKRIVNHAVINEDPNNRIIRELREEVEQLREQLMHATVQTELRERLVESEKLIRDMEQTWEEKLRKTEKIHQERQLALEKMGISVQSSGIAVEKDRYYLVNLNADPSMNALLVYYLKELTLIGRPDSEEEQDIQLSGVGIMPEHAIIEIDKERNELWMETINGARTYVNGVPVQERVKLRNGDRILWGNNHFFSLNCPASRSEIYEDNANHYFDYNYARDEMLSYNNPDLEAAMFALERQFEEPSFRAPNQNWSANMGKMPGMSPMDGSNKFGGSMYGRLGGSSLNLSSPAAMATYRRMEKLAQEREENFRISLANLREEIAKANTLAHEANLIAEEMRRNTEFKVTLQIPAANLSPNRLKRGVFVSEPAILVKRKNCPSQVWSMEKFDSNLIEMRELYTEWKERKNERHLKNQNSVSSDTSFDSDRSDASPRIHQHNDPFYEFQESHLLIGVANIFLEVLMQDVMLDYQVPIISQQGEVAGRLHVEFGRVEGDFGERMADASASDADASSDDASNDGHFECTNTTTITASTKSQPLGANQIRVRLNLKSARGLPLELSNFVFCQYSVWGYSDLIVITPVESDFDSPSRTRTSTPKSFELGSSNEQVFYFDHHRDFIITLSEEFRELCTDGALSIEVWGHRISANNADKMLNSEWGVAEEQMKISRSLSDRWLELKKKVELWVEIHELNEQGEYTPVEVQIQPDVFTGGVYQLRQGQQRRISVRVMQIPNSGTLPFVCESVRFVAAGCVCVRSRVQKSLDSYQEGDLTALREKWSEILQKRQAYLQEQINELMSKTNKSQEEVEREHNLMNQWVSLVEERKAAKCPSSGSEIPGAPDDHWEPPLGMEIHIPVIYLDLNTDELNLSSGRISEVAGSNSILPKEHNGTPFVNLSIVSASTAPMDGVSAVVVWDSSLHESPHLNRITAANERIFLILKVCVRLSHPANMDLIFRKRIAINVYKKQSFTKNIFKRISRADMPLFSTGLTYEIVSSIPKASEDIEDRESLALLAASGVDLTACDGESYIERYTKSVSAVESILTLDRLRQEVAVREQIAKKAKVALQTSNASPSPAYLSTSGNESLLRKTLSVPNMAQLGPLQPHRATGQVISIGSDPRSQTMSTSITTGSIPRGPITANGSLRYDSSFDLSYLTSAADRLRQKASSLFGSMTGLNQLGSENSFTEEPPHPQPVKNFENNTRGPSSSTPGSLVSPASGKSRKPMCTVLEEQNDESSEATRQHASNQVRVQVTPSDRPLETGDESDGEDSCYIVFEPPRDKRMHLLEDEDDEVDRYVKLGNNLRVDSCTPTLSIASSTPHSESALGSMPSSTGSGDEEDSLEQTRPLKPELPAWMTVGESVRISPDSKLGTIAYIGETVFAPGLWIGVELDTPTGKNDGTVNGVRYFPCKPKFGIFVKPDKLKLDSRGRQIRMNNKVNGRK